jgi:hypothetical protein
MHLNDLRCEVFAVSSTELYVKLFNIKEVVMEPEITVAKDLISLSP